MRMGPNDGMVVRKKCVCFAFWHGGKLHVEKQVFEMRGRCPITGKDPAWVDGHTLKKTNYANLNRPVPRAIVSRYRPGNRVKFLRCRSCSYYLKCQRDIHARCTFKPTPAPWAV